MQRRRLGQHRVDVASLLESPHKGTQDTVAKLTPGKGKRKRSENTDATETKKMKPNQKENNEAIGAVTVKSATKSKEPQEIQDQEKLKVQEVASLRSKLHKQETEISDLKSKLSQSISNNEKLVAQLEATLQFETSLQELEELRKKFIELEKINSQLKKDQIITSQTIKKLQEELHEKAKDVQQLESERIASLGHVTELNSISSKLDESIVTVKSQEKKIKALDKQNASLKKKLESAKEKQNETKQKLQHAKQTETDLRAEIEERKIAVALFSSVLTVTKATSKSEFSVNVVCKSPATDKSMSFYLSETENDPDMVFYSPNSINLGPSDEVPLFVTKGLFFSKTEMPVFIAKVVNLVAK